MANPEAVVMTILAPMWILSRVDEPLMTEKLQ
jgi:hypothetical protein